MKRETKSDKSPGKMNKKKLDNLIKTLREGDGFAKGKAQEALMAVPDKSVVERVAPLLKAPDTGTRMIALEILKALGNYNLDVIISLLDDENEDVRVYAGEIIACLKNPDAIPHLIRKTTGDADNVRNSACLALGEFVDERAVDALLEALKDDDWVSFSAIFSLGKIGNKRAIPHLLEVLKNGSEEISLAACETLIDFRDPEILDKVIETMREWDGKKRDSYMKVMLEKGEKDIFLRMMEKIGEELLGHLLSCVSYEDKRTLPIMKMLSYFKTPSACSAVLDTLARLDTEAEEYDEIMEAFVRLKEVWANDIAGYISKGDQYYLPIIKACAAGGVKIDEARLLEIFKSSPADVKREIINNIRNISDGTAHRVIREAISDPDGHVQGSAAVAAGTLGIVELKEQIREITRSSYPDVRSKALKALIKLDMSGAVSLMDEFVNNGSTDDKKVFLSAAGALDNDRNFPYITKLLQDKDEGIRKATIGVFGNFLEDKRYMEILAALLKNDEVPNEALKVVKEKRLTIFRDRLVDLFMDRNKGMWTRYYALSALDAFRDHTLFDLFLKGLEDENSLIKIGSVNALSGLEDPRALLHIVPFTESEDDDVRSSAEAAIGRLENL
jgi:HEAT repeat protein